MADNVTVDNGDLTDFAVSADEGAGGQVQRVKLTYSADGSEVHIPADANGLRVDLSSNNDVIVTSGTVSAIAGTVTTSVAGTANVAITGNPVGGFGTSFLGYVGVASSGTAVTDTLSLTSGTATAVGIYDGDGDQVTFPTVQQFTAAPTLGTGANAQYDSLHTTIITMSGVVGANGGVGQVLGADMASKHNSFSGTIKAYLFDTSFTGTTAQDALSISDTDILNCFGTLEFDFSNSNGAASRVAAANRVDLPLMFKCDAAVDDIFVVLQLWSADTPTFAASDLQLRLYILAES